MGNTRNRLLDSLPPADLALLNRHLRLIPVEQGQMLEEPGRPTDRVYFPQTGMISLIVAMVEDCALEVGTVGKEGAIGLITGIGSRISAVQALVQVSGTAWRIPAARFASASARSPRIRTMIARYSDLLLAQVQQTAACNALHDATSRVCRWLLQTSDTIDSDRIPFTQEFLAEMLGVQRTTVSEVIRKLHTAGLVETRYREIHIVDRAKLRQQACECYDIIRKHMNRMVVRP